MSIENKRKPTPSMYEDEEAMRELEKLITARRITRSQTNKLKETQNLKETDGKEANNIEPKIKHKAATKPSTSKAKITEKEKDKIADNVFKTKPNSKETVATKSKETESTKLKSKMIYQFKITLEGTKPVVWRRIQVPGTFTFLDLHNIIQTSMGWYNCHNHVFRMLNQNANKEIEIGPYHPFDLDLGLPKPIKESTAQIFSYFSLEPCTVPNVRLDCYSIAKYEYDFGDSWTHVVQLESISEAKSNERYPKCTEGKNACPPEDCGSTPGFANLKKILKNPKHPEYKEMVNWLRFDRSGAGPYDPSYFDPKKVRF